MIAYISYVHIFMLFPIMFYTICGLASSKLYSYNVRLIMAILAIIVLLTHLFQAKGWLNEYPTFFMPFSTNAVGQFISLPFGGKITIICYILLSTLIFYNLFT